MNSCWTGKRVVVTGGASFIGSHLVSKLLSRGAIVHAVDDLSKGALENLSEACRHPAFKFSKLDLLNRSNAAKVVADANMVFHLAARHGGRYYIEANRELTSENFEIDQNVMAAAAACAVEKLVFASSACVYPRRLQTAGHFGVPLRELDDAPPDDPDQIYGAAKLKAERTLLSYVQTGALKGASCRYFTVYGPRSPEDHSVTALIAKGLQSKTTLELWGDGKQVRSWVYVDDVVRGTILAAERIDDGSSVNLGSPTPLTVTQLAEAILGELGVRKEIVNNLQMPVGPHCRVPDISKASWALDWTPEVPLIVGLQNSIAWYRSDRLIFAGQGLEARLLGISDDVRSAEAGA